jgi:hypothetical protein
MTLQQAEITLRQTRLTALGSFSRKAAKLTTPDYLFMKTCDELAVQLATRVLTQHLEDKQTTVTFSPPATWWQHWKQDHAPRWFTRRWPIRYKTVERTVEYEVCAMYPEADLLLPNLGPAVIHVLR